MKRKSQKYQAIIKELEQKIHALLEGKTSLTADELINSLEIDPFEKPIVKDLIEIMHEQKRLKKTKNKYSLTSAPSTQFLRGKLSLHPRGFGFVKVQQYKEVFIPRFATKNAVDGDVVEILLTTDYQAEKPEGKIVNILERNRTHLGGTLLWKQQDIWKVYVPLMPDRHVKVKATGSFAKGDRVIIHVSDWGKTEKQAIIGEITKKIGHIDDPAVDIEAIIEEYQLHDAFSHEAIAEAKKWGKEVPLSEIKNRTDLLDFTCITIDPTTAKDFDDALSLTIDDNGHYNLGVHIADVAHYVPFHSILDEEAYRRGNSTYFPDRVLPMLPFELSANLCSLKENETRLTISVLMEFDSSGKLLNHQIVRSAIKSSKRFTYEEAFSIIEKKKEDPHSDLLSNLATLGLLLRGARAKRGSIDFSLDEASIEIDEKGVPTGLKIHKYDISHQLVEEFMLKANEIIATHLSEQEKGAIFRIHQSPDESSMEEFFSFARALGFFVPAKPRTKDIQTIFDKAKETPYTDQLSLYFIKSMKLAHYSPHNIGHYGLALDNYCHFTSPIRRFSDLIAQRLLFDDLPEDISLPDIADNCSRLERISSNAEQAVILMKKLRLVKKQWKNNTNQLFEAVITNIKSAGIVFEVKGFFIEGFIHSSDLEYNLQFNPNLIRLENKKTGFSLSLGQKIQVKLVEINLISLSTKWSIIHQKG